jgi:hypothetical protein
VFLTAWISIAVCLGALLLTLVMQHRTALTLGLPLAYMISLMVIHLPGAYAFAYSGGQYTGLQAYPDSVETGVMLTAIAAICFVIGAAFAARRRAADYARAGVYITDRLDPKFQAFCLVCSLFLLFGAGPLRAIPTVGAAVYFGSTIWMLPASLGLERHVRERNVVGAAGWLAAVVAYPLVMLVMSGFLSYGSTAVIIIGSLSVIRMKNPMRSMLLIVVLGYLGMSVFVNYFGSRSVLRSSIWGGDAIEQRIDVVVDAFSDFKLLSQNNPDHMRALSLRLNQNEFVGASATRLTTGQSEYLHGETFRDALLAPIPRILWPSKPGEGGSGQIVREMTGMQLQRDTSWGVGNVMEFYINFGLWSLIPGMLLLGYVIGWVDNRAAVCLRSRDHSKSLIYFLPGVAMIQPNGSLVEVVGGSFAALVAAIGIRMVWKVISPNPVVQSNIAGALPRRLQ